MKKCWQSRLWVNSLRGMNKVVVKSAKKKWCFTEEKYHFIQEEDLLCRAGLETKPRPQSRSRGFVWPGLVT